MVTDSPTPVDTVTTTTIWVGEHQDTTQEIVTMVTDSPTPVDTVTTTWV